MSTPAEVLRRVGEVLVLLLVALLYLVVLTRGQVLDVLIR